MPSDGGQVAAAPAAAPIRRGRGNGERYATWLELFFDLVFVVAVTELAAVLHHDPSPVGFLAFAALFVPVW